MKRQPYAGFIVTWGDGMGLCVVMGADKTCPGALEGVFTAPGLVFATKPDAQKAIRISKLWNSIRKERGEPHCKDFTEATKWLRIVPLLQAPGQRGEG